MGPLIIYDFTKESNTRDWRVVDDVVMGGKSSGKIVVNAAGHGVFEGNVSLDNNGGFSSLRYQADRIAVKEYTRVVLHLKGDGKNYQFRIKSNAEDYYSYIATFMTSGDWQTIEIPLKEMYPSFRGRKLDQPDFSSDHIEEIAFLIGNKKAETFKLIIDKIELQ